MGKITEKELAVIKRIYDLGGLYGDVHYESLIEVIFSEEIREKYRPLKIQRMACSYLGRMDRKDLIHSHYHTDKSFTFFSGYYLRPKGREVLKEIGYVK